MLQSSADVCVTAAEQWQYMVTTFVTTRRNPQVDTSCLPGFDRDLFTCSPTNFEQRVEGIYVSVPELKKSGINEGVDQLHPRAPPVLPKSRSNS